MSNAEEKAQEVKNFKNTSIRFSIRFNYVLFPFDTVELISILMKSGYAPTAPPPPAAPPRGIRFTITGTIARKGEILIDINDDRGILSATSPSPALSINGLNEVLQLIRTNLNVDLEKQASFYELIGHTALETDRHPFEKIGNIIKGNKIIEKLGEVLGEDVSLFTLKLAPRGHVPNQTEWFDLTIEPDIIKTSTYNISAVFRSHEKSEVQKFTEEFMPNVSKLIVVIESS